MNAPQNIEPARDRYIPIVRHHVPACDDEQLELRCSLLMIRDQASSKMGRCSDEAYGVLQEVQRLATTYAFARIPTEELSHLRYQLLRLTMAASGLEMFAFRLAYPDGGTDEGG